MGAPDSISAYDGPPYDARQVANFILLSAFEAGDEVTQLRLYKLLYFAHGWYLVEHSSPLVWNSFEAWDNGPVIKVVRDCFASFAASPITSFASIFDLRQGMSVELPRRLLPNDERFVFGVIEAHRRYSAEQLSLITHEKGSPWDRIWKSHKPVGRFGLRITNDEILNDLRDVVSDGESADITGFIQSVG